MAALDVDLDFDFLNYLDFTSSTEHNAPALFDESESGLSSISSDHSTYASPHEQHDVDADFIDASNSVSSTGGCSPWDLASLSPGYGAGARAPNSSMANTTGKSNNGEGLLQNQLGPAALLQQQQFAPQQVPQPSWANSAPQAMIGNDSPPFDLSMYQAGPRPLARHQNTIRQENSKPFDFSSFGGINLLDFTQPQFQSTQKPMQWQAQQIVSNPYPTSSLANPTVPGFQPVSSPNMASSFGGASSSSASGFSPNYSGSSNFASPSHSDFSSTDRRPSIAGLGQSTHTNFPLFATVPAAPANGAAKPFSPKEFPSTDVRSTSDPATAAVQTPEEMHASAQVAAPAPAIGAPFKKATLKRSYQQVKQEEADAAVPGSDEQARSQAMQKGNSENRSTSGSGDDAKPAKGGHNAVEQKYRRGINDSLIMLREIVPALQHLRAAPGTESSKRKVSQFSLAASVTPAAPSGFVDGVMAPKKLSKQLILVTATDYIRFLQSKREELEGELHVLKQTLDDCLEDSSIVRDLAEQRFAPERRRILAEREQIHASRTTKKDSSKKRRINNAKGDKENDGMAAAAGNAGSDAEDSDDSADEDEDEDDEMEDQPSATASALQKKGQVRARGTGRTPAGAHKRKPAKAAANAKSQQQQASGPPKALMSVFAGVSFFGGASYDVLYGASGSAPQTAAQDATVNPAQVWSHGLLKRGLNANTTFDNAQLNPIQRFFVERPALLSGTIMLALSVVVSYIFLYVLPSLFASFTRRTRLQQRANARATLLACAQNAETVSVRQRQGALLVLSHLPTSTVLQAFALPSVCVRAASAWVFGEASSKATTPDSVEQAASSIKLLEAVTLSGTPHTGLLAHLVFLRVYSLIKSARWPSSSKHPGLFVRGHATLALASLALYGRTANGFAAESWSRAQGVLKKGDSSPKWLALALSQKLQHVDASVEDNRKNDQARTASLVQQKSLFAIAEALCERELLKAWQKVFTAVMDVTCSPSDPSPETATLPAKGLSGEEDLENEQGGTTPRLSTLVNDETVLAPAARWVQPDISDELQTVLDAMPVGSRLYDLALLCHGISSLGSNDRGVAVQVASHLHRSDSRLQSSRAFVRLLAGVPSLGDAVNLTTSDDLDTLAYTTVEWLAVRAMVTRSDNASKDKEAVPANKDAIQSSTIALRSLLALAKVFTTAADTTEPGSSSFIEAQELCIEGLVGFSRRAAGLVDPENQSDSGCEL